MACQFHRGTGSGPSACLGRAGGVWRGLGFRARVCLPLRQARCLLGRCLPDLRGAREPGHIALDPIRECQRKKSHGTDQISTDLTMACGGFSGGDIFGSG